MASLSSRNQTLAIAVKKHKNFTGFFHFVPNILSGITGIKGAMHLKRVLFVFHLSIQYFKLRFSPIKSTSSVNFSNCNYILKKIRPC